MRSIDRSAYGLQVPSSSSVFAQNPNRLSENKGRNMTRWGDRSKLLLHIGRFSRGRCILPPESTSYLTKIKTIRHPFFSLRFLPSSRSIFSSHPFISSPPVTAFGSTSKSALLRIHPSFPTGGQKRTMFIQTQSTPNPHSIMFYPGKPVMEIGSSDFPNARTAMPSPLAKSLFAIDGVARVFFSSDFITVTKSDDSSWDFLKPEIFAAIMDFYSSGNPLFVNSSVAASMDTAIHEDDSEIVAMIKELLETRIRPSVQDDGGDIEYRGYDPESGLVKLKMQGACSGCPSSSVTLKSGIENMLMHYIPEVRGVEQELDNDDDATVSSSIN